MFFLFSCFCAFLYTFLWHIVVFFETCKTVGNPWSLANDNNMQFRLRETGVVLKLKSALSSKVNQMLVHSHQRPSVCHLLFKKKNYLVVTFQVRKKWRNFTVTLETQNFIWKNYFSIGSDVVGKCEHLGSSVKFGSQLSVSKRTFCNGNEVRNGLLGFFL